MILTFDVPPLSRGQEPCDIDSSEKNQKYQKNWEVLARQNQSDYNL